ETGATTRRRSQIPDVLRVPPASCASPPRASRPRDRLRRPPYLESGVRSQTRPARFQYQGRAPWPELGRPQPTQPRRVRDAWDHASCPNPRRSRRTACERAVGRVAKGAGCVRRRSSTGARTSGRARADSKRVQVNANVLTFLDPEHRRSVAAVDRDRDVPVGILVEDDVARPGVGECARRDGVIAFRPGLQLDAGPGHDTGLIEVGAFEIKPDVPEPVDRQYGPVDPGRAEVWLRDVQTSQGIWIDRWPELAERDAECEMGGRRSEEVAAVERARD